MRHPRGERGDEHVEAAERALGFAAAVALLERVLEAGAAGDGLEARVAADGVALAELRLPADLAALAVVAVDERVRTRFGELEQDLARKRGGAGDHGGAAQAGDPREQELGVGERAPARIRGVWQDDRRRAHCGAAYHLLAATR